jgi:predicted Zn-dependent protease with MMP-like domain
MAYHVSKSQFAALVETALESVPEPFAQHLEEIAVEIVDRPAPSQLRKLGARRGDLLLGLYTGRPLTRRSVEDSAYMPDSILIFQWNIELVCNSEQELIEQVRKTVLHEIGHHFGMDEEDLDALGYG